MKHTLLILLGFLGLTLHAPAQQEPATTRVNAYEAMRAAQGHVAPQAKDLILGIKGQRGNPNPAVWEVTFFDPLEKDKKLILEMQGANVRKVNRPLEFFGSVGQKYAIDLGKLRMNSDGAFNMAKEIAEKENNLLISRADYVLTKIKPEDPDSNPIWILNVYDAQNHHLGEVTISAYTGNVLRTRKLKHQGKRDATFTERVGQSFDKLGQNMEEFFSGKKDSKK
ncbi:hypothetical protein QQ056_14640 [Oscillatoria laete-virens NRMC-F 0139]|nr:hypothetical protein [Oscillatoria laete-virens]MDL5054774.1 hypothetical protein [Oscillatoria laete-virens NRMC-F 0139]